MYRRKRVRFLRAPLRALSSPPHSRLRGPGRAARFLRAEARLCCAWLLGSRVERRRTGGPAATAGARMDAREFGESTGMCLAEPRRCDANPAQRGAQLGRPFSWLLLFGQAKRSDSAPAEGDETSRQQSECE